MTPSFHIITFGCQMNVRDSQWLTAALTQRGLREASEADADIVLINTCSVREKPQRRVKAALDRLLRINKKRAAIGILGCVAQQCGETLLSLAPQVKLVSGPDGLVLVPDAVLNLLAAPGGKMTFLEFSAEYPERPPLTQNCKGRSAYVNIMQGCDNFCAYCIVPFTRGRQKSRSRPTIIDECKSWLACGAVEITLLGQNVNVWGGKGKNADSSFSALLREIASLPGLERLRFVTPHPADMGPHVIDCLGELDNLCPRLHLPLQSGSDKILKVMGRRHSRAEYLDLIDRLREARPDLQFSTDLIVGFPGETEADFAHTVELVQECSFVSSFSFCYSDRPGTRAALLPDKVPEDIKLERLQRLQEVQDAITASNLGARIGGKTTVLLENPSPRGHVNSWQGRDPYGICVNVVMPDERDYAGHMVPCMITESKKHSLTGCLETQHTPRA